jgi:putative inorganic carbon (HCO3(-)) transporter
MLVMHHAGIRSVNGPGYLMSFVSLGVLAACAAALTDARGRRTVLWVLSGAVVLVCAYSLLQYFNIRVFPWDVYLNTTGRVSGSLGNPNLLGGFLAAMLPVTIGLVLSTGWRSRSKVLLIAFATVLTILTISASGTRSSLIGLTAGALFMGILSLKGSRSRVVAVAGVAVLVLTGILMRGRISELTSAGRGTMQVRLVIWEGAAGMIGDAPLTGFGPGSFQMLFPGYRNPEYNLLGVSHNTLHAHNEYLEILTDSGLVGMALFVLLAYALVRGMRGTAGWGGFPDPAVGGLAAGIFAMLCEASVSVALRWPPSAYLLALLTGLLAGAVPAAPPRPMRRIVAVPLLAAAAFGLAVGIPHYLRFLRSGYLLFIGKDLTLDTIEQELSLAYGAATAWEQTGDQTRRVEALQRYDHADVLCDSAIELCNRCVTVNPDELGGYYGLGSAWLTRAIIIEPPNPSLSRLLDADGRVRSRDSALAATRMALQAYQALAVRAPDYAELHNNLALTYTRLGQPAMTIRSMRRAYELYAHRRWNYLRQAFELAPLGGAWDALHINMSAI